MHILLVYYFSYGIVYSLILQEVFEELLLVLLFELVQSYAIQIWDINLVSSNLDTFNILELVESPSLS